MPLRRPGSSLANNGRVHIDTATIWSAPAERSGDGALAPGACLATLKAVSRSHSTYSKHNELGGSGEMHSGTSASRQSPCQKQSGIKAGKGTGWNPLRNGKKPGRPPPPEASSFANHRRQKQFLL